MFKDKISNNLSNRKELKISYIMRDWLEMGIPVSVFVKIVDFTIVYFMRLH